MHKFSEYSAISSIGIMLCMHCYTVIHVVILKLFRVEIFDLYSQCQCRCMEPCYCEGHVYRIGKATQSLLRHERKRTGTYLLEMMTGLAFKINIILSLKRLSKFLSMSFPIVA